MGESFLLYHSPSTSISPFLSHRSILIRSSLARFPQSINANPNRIWSKFVNPTEIKVVSDSKTPVLVFESVNRGGSEIQPEIGGGGGEGGSGGGGGGSGGGGGEGESSERKKKGGMSMSQKFTLAYAALVGVGGVMGYMKTGSTKSLVAGGISAAVLGYVYTALPTNPTLASAIGLGISAALLGVMGSRFKKSGKVFPAGVVSAMSLVMTAGYLHGIMRTASH